MTTFLYARPSFIEGIARLIDFGNTLQQYNTSLTSKQADSIALYSDWCAVENDLNKAFYEISLGYTEELASTADKRDIRSMTDKYEAEILEYKRLRREIREKLISETRQSMLSML